MYFHILDLTVLLPGTKNPLFGVLDSEVARSRNIRNEVEFPSNREPNNLVSALY